MRKLLYVRSPVAAAAAAQLVVVLAAVVRHSGVGRNDALASGHLAWPLTTRVIIYQ